MRAVPDVRLVRVLAGPLVIVAAVAALSGARARAVPVPSAVLAGTGVLDNVTATSATNAWAVGHFGALTKASALLEHWNGTAWHRVPLKPASGWLDGVAATSARDVWAVGIASNRTLILHFNGTSWRRVASPAVPGGSSVLADVAAISPRNAWAVGLAGFKTLIEHWDGRRWQRVRSPSPGKFAFLTGVAAASARDAWAVGQSGTGALIMHWNGTAWRRMPSPVSSARAVLERVTVISPRDVWAVGTSGRKVLIVHWNGVAWHRTPGPALGATASLVGVSGTSARNAWAVGVLGTSLTARPALASLRGPGAGHVQAGHRAARAQALTPLILHWDGTAWRRASIPVPAGGGEVLGVFAGSGRNAWAVGCTKNFAARKARPLVLHWNGATWK